MKKRLISTYNIDALSCNYLEYCHFEWEAYKDLLSYVLLIRNEYSLEYNKETFDHFMAELKEAKYKYNLKLRDVIDEYCPQYQGSLKHDFLVDFEKATLEIYLIEEA
jgi:hypothetical protein